MSFVKNGATDVMDFARDTFTVTGTNSVHQRQTIPTDASGTAISLGVGGTGGIATLGYGIFVNRDATNYIELMTAVSGTKIAKLFPGEVAMFRFGSGVTAPAAIANSTACLLEYLIVEA